MSQYLKLVIVSLLTIALCVLIALKWPLIGAVGASFLGLAVISSFYSSIQEVKASQTKLKTETENKISAVIDNVPDAVVMYTDKFEVLNINKEAERLFRLKKKDIQGKIINPSMIRDESLRLLITVVFPSLAPSMNQVSGEGWPQVVELSLDNTGMKLRLTLSLLLDEHGAALGFMKIIHDETREKNILSSKSEFISVAAHQLRTPLTAIKWSFEHLQKNLATQKDLLDIAVEGHGLSERTLKIVDDLLDASKLEEGRFGFVKETISLKTIIQEVLVSAQTVAKELGITLITFEDSDNCIVNLDKAKFSMALSNVIDNAIRYNTEHGKVTVAWKKDPAHRNVSVTISDTGIGIPKKDTVKLFEKFYRGTNVIQLHPNGTGLGLYITKNIIEANGGKIMIDSVENRGTAVTIILPIAEPA